MVWWERLIYVASLAFWRAYFEARILVKYASEEKATPEDATRIRNFRDAVRRVRDAENSTGSKNSA